VTNSQLPPGVISDNKHFFLTEAEQCALRSVLQDWLDDSFSRGVDCGEEEVISSYEQTLTSLAWLFDEYGINWAYYHDEVEV
jgi:hypothetical protein